MKPVERLTAFSFEHPRIVLALAALITCLFALTFARARVDTDPENMLEADQPDRVLYDRVKRDFDLHDMIVVGIVDERSIYRIEALERVERLVAGIARIRGVIAERIVSLSTTNNATSAAGIVDIRPVMEQVPRDDAGLERLRHAVSGNRFLNEKLVSADGRAIAVYVPIRAKNESLRIAEEIRSLLRREPLPGQTAHVAGLPVAEDTFGREMFVQMAVVAPLAFLGILLLVFLLFRDFSFLAPVGLVAALSVIWSMGALIATGHTVHIMSSMIAVFLMPIAILDSVHILSELSDRRRATGDRGRALREGMRFLYRPMLFTSLTTAVGFGSLAFSQIPPVRVFGLFVAFGTAVAWVLTHTLLPAMFALGGDRSVPGVEPGRRAERPSRLDPVLRALGGFGFRRARWVLVLALGLIAVSILGMQRIRVDDNPVRWFRPGHPMRVSDDAMNRRFGGTYMAYLVAEGDAAGAVERPEVVAYLDRIQRRLESMAVVGKTSSVADVVKRVNLVLHDNDPSYDRVPEDRESVGQLLFIFQGSAQPGELENLMDREGRRANIWIQMRGGDNHQMEEVEGTLARFLREEPPPAGIAFRWSGLNHINKVWQGLMVTGMLKAVLSSFLVVLVLMVFEFKSWLLGLLSMVPLTVAIAFSYGTLGLIGKPYDMPIAVCSSLALGLAIDFAIHFFERFRAHWPGSGDLEETNRYMCGPPGRAIARNAIVITVGFLPLVASTLTPYVTVSVFFAALMMASAAATLLLLPAAVRVIGPRALR